MNKPFADELVKELLKYPTITRDAWPMYTTHLNAHHKRNGWIEFRPIINKPSKPLDRTMSLCCNDDFAFFDSEYIDGRRKKRFYLDQYDCTEELIKDMVVYLIVSIEKYYKPYTNTNNIIKKWSNSGIHPMVAEHEEGKVVGTF